MNKWFLRLFVALLTFILSVALTGALRFLFGDGPRPAVDIQMVEAPQPFLDFSGDQAQIEAIYNEYGLAQTRTIARFSSASRRRISCSLPAASDSRASRISSGWRASRRTCR